MKNQIMIENINPDEISQSYIDWLNDEEVTKHLDTQKATIDSCKRYVNRHKLNPFFEIFYIKVLVEKKKFDEFKEIGTCTVSDINFNKNIAEIGIMIGDKDYWGKGIGQDVVKLLKQRLKDKFGITRLKLGVKPGNLAAINCYKKCGFKITEILMEVK